MKDPVRCVALGLTLLALVSCGRTDFSFRTTGGWHHSGSVGVQGGGARYGLGEASVLFGSLFAKGQRRYTYLVISPRCNGGEAYFESASSAHCGGGTAGSTCATEDSCTFGEATISASFAASVGPEGVIADQKLELQGVEVDPSSGWLYLLDIRQPGASPRLHKIDLEMPALPDSKAELFAFTMRYVDRLVEQDPIVAAFVNS